MGSRVRAATCFVFSGAGKKQRADIKVRAFVPRSYRDSSRLCRVLCLTGEQWTPRNPIFLLRPDYLLRKHTRLRFPSFFRLRYCSRYSNVFSIPRFEDCSGLLLDETRSKDVRIKTRILAFSVQYSNSCNRNVFL